MTFTSSEFMGTTIFVFVASDFSTGFEDLGLPSRPFETRLAPIVLVSSF